MPFIWIDTVNSAHPYTILIGPEMSIRSLRLKIAHIERINTAILEYRGKLLNDSKYLVDYDIKDQDRIKQLARI